MMTVTVDTQAFKRDFNLLQREQFPFAFARALTWVASDAQKEVRRDIPRRFITRNKWVVQGVRTEKATKTKFESVVKHIDPYMTKHEDGDRKRPPQGKHLIAPAAVKKGKSGIVSKAQRRATLNEQNPNTFKIDEDTPGAKRHHLHFGIYKRNRRGRRPILLWSLFPTAPIKPVFHFEDTVRRTVQQRFERLFDVSLDQAMKSTI